MAVLKLKFLKAKKLFTMCMFVMMLFTTVFVVVQLSTYPFDDMDQVIRRKKIDELIKTSSSNDACRQPYLPVYAPEMMAFDEFVPPIDCSAAQPNWVRCRNHQCKLSKDTISRYGHAFCQYKNVYRVDDFKLKEAETISASIFNLSNTDVVKVVCKSKNGSTWSGTLTAIRHQNDLDAANWDTVKNGLKLNVLMFGFDSISHNMFIRKLPKSYQYLTKQLGSLVLQGYNIIGDGTPQALIPILTGHTEIELPDTRKRNKNASFVDVYPFIWKKYKDAGYITGFLEDVPESGTFTYRLSGFHDQPTDHYMRPYYLAVRQEWKNGLKYCAGSIPRHQVMMNYIKDFFSVYKNKPKFMFGFQGELSHDSCNLITAIDNDLVTFLKDLFRSRALNNTLLIVMSDHGNRFTNIRNTIQGKLEERLPFFSFTFPKWFKKVHRKLYNNFIENIHTLTTPFDIHATLKSILNIESIPNIGDLKQRSISLFSMIPRQRSCRDAYIEPHWCACLEWYNINITEPIVPLIASTLVETINKFTRTHRHLCAELHLKEIYWATRMRPNLHLLKFQSNADIDGFVPNLSANTLLNSDVYQVKVMLEPGSSLFEFSVTHIFKGNKLIINLSDISRINMYKEQAKCVASDFPHLEKYCYCRDLL